MNKKLLGFLIFLSLFIVVAEGYLLFAHNPLLEKNEDTTEISNQDAQNNNVEKRRNEVFAEEQPDNKTIEIYTIQSGEKNALGIFPKRSSVFFYPDREEVIVITPPRLTYDVEKKIDIEIEGSVEKISLENPEEHISILSFNNTPVKIFGDDRKIIFSPDERKFIFSFSDEKENHPNIGLVDIDNNEEIFRVVYESKNQPPFYSEQLHAVPLFWDNNDNMYVGFHRHLGSCDPPWKGSSIIISKEGSVSEQNNVTSFLGKQDLASISPNGSYFVGIQEHPEGIESIGMCSHKNYGIITLYSVNDDSSEIIQSDSDKDFWFVTWVDKSNAFIYKQRSATNVNQDSSSEYEKYVLYDVYEGEKEIFQSSQEMNTWLEKDTEQNNSFEKIF